MKNKVKLPEVLSTAIDKQSIKYAQNYELRSMVQLLPYVGGALDTILSAEGNRIQKERLERFLEALNEGLNKLDEAKIDKVFLESEEFFSLFQMTIEKVIRNYEKEKTRYFKNIFINSIKRGKSKTYYKEGFIDIIANLSAIHIAILKYYFEKIECFKREKRQSVMFTSPNELYQKFNDVIPTYLDAYCNNLLSNGLLRVTAVDGNIIGDRENCNSYSPTEYALEFLKFITEEKK